MTAEAAEALGTDAQREPRTNVFVMAAIYGEAGSTPVKVRNVSPGGALIEGAVVPPPGSRVRLCRGSMSVTAEVAWSEDGRAGLHFESAVCVADWLPGGRGTSHQQCVDEMIQEVRASHLVSVPAGGCPGPQSNEVTAVELTRLTEAVESLAHDLARDPAVVKRHMLRLQTLDLAAQTLRKLAAER